VFEQNETRGAGSGGRGRSDRMMMRSRRFAGPANGKSKQATQIISDYQKTKMWDFRPSVLTSAAL
jgi:hypothetical protein